MNKTIAAAIIAASILPSVALAAYNDVTLTSDAVISVDGYTLDVSGSSEVIQSITVNADSFSVTLASGSYLTVSSPTLNQLSSDVTSDVSRNICNSSASSISLAYSGAGTVTNVITPSGTICTNSGGGGIVGSGPLAPGYVNTNPTPNAGENTITANAVATLATTSSEEGAATAASSNVQSAANASTPAPTSGSAAPSATASSFNFTRNLAYWMVGSDVRQLQHYLNTHGFPVALSGAGSPGDETDLFGPATYHALVKFQAARGLPATGYFGPMTRAAIAAGSAPSSSPAGSSLTSAQVQSIVNVLESFGADQATLNAVQAALTGSSSTAQ